MPLQTILVEQTGGVARVTLHRPDVRNAFNEVLIREVTETFRDLASRPDVRVLVLTGAGSAFCAGADIHWMGRMKGFSYEENLRDTQALADMFAEIDRFPRPTIARVNGAAIGGGNGFLSTCDIVIAAESAKFSLSEVKLGLVPACISPYLVRRIGVAGARELFLTGERFGAAKALAVGLVNRVVPDAQLDAETDGLVSQLLTSGPEAVAASKELIRQVSILPPEAANRYAVETLARLRVGAEAQEGMQAFFEKRSPRWAHGT